MIQNYRTPYSSYGIRIRPSFLAANVFVTEERGKERGRVNRSRGFFEHVVRIEEQVRSRPFGVTDDSDMHITHNASGDTLRRPIVTATSLFRSVYALCRFLQSRSVIATL